MTQEMRETLLMTLVGAWMMFIGVYGLLTVSVSWIFIVVIPMGALLFIPNMWEMINWNKKKD